VIIAGAGVSLIFDYNFVEGVGSNNDEFGAFILERFKTFSRVNVHGEAGPPIPCNPFGPSGD